MSRKQNEGNVYSFTTTEKDPYLERVVAEATNDTDFIVTTERDTVRGEGTTAVLLVRKDVVSVGLVFPELTLAGKTLGDWVEFLIDEPNDSDWAQVVITGEPEDIALDLVHIRNEIRRINNLKNGRTVRVKVESF